MNPSPSPARSHYESWHTGLAIDNDDAIDAPWHRLLKPHLALGGRRVLEVAAGRGGFAAWMASRPLPARPRQLVALDFAHAAIASAARLATRRGLRINVAQADIQRLPFADGTFDIVVSCETLEHVPDPRAAVAELYRVLAPGGDLYLTIPNYFSVTGLYRVFREWTGRPWQEMGQPINHPLRAFRVRRWLTDAGFAIVRSMGAGHYLPIPRREPMRIAALDRLTPLRLCASHVAFVARRPL